MNTEDLLIEPEFLLHWQMHSVEQLVMRHILSIVRPGLALEIGTYHGGSLQAIAKYSQRVISLDLDPEIPSKIGDGFSNVEFISGDSKITLPRVIQKLNEKDDTPGFVLIDGDHSEVGVRTDIEALLRLRPSREVIILLHDSFNPACRLGMLSADWASSEFVHQVDIDFSNTGGFVTESFDTAKNGSMWGGLACAIMKPRPRQGELVIKASQTHLHEAIKRISIHQSTDQNTTNSRLASLRKALSLGRK